MNSKNAKSLIQEISAVIVPKMFNIKNGTATKQEQMVVFEAQGFLSLLRFSCLSVREIKEIWEKSSLRYM